jgi:uncharacterized protein (TIGR03663 family)
MSEAAHHQATSVTERIRQYVRDLGSAGAAILVLALVLRVLWLNLKPPHFDEGVNGWFVDEMMRQVFYRYDPSNFHGPLHFYILFVAQTLFGRAAWVLRLPIALISTACIALALAFSRHLDRRACQIAALAMAVSPAMVFYGKYAIHETELLFFLMLTTWGMAMLWREGTRSGLWAVGLGVTGMILTKETYAIHLVSLALAIPTLLLLEKVAPSIPSARAIPSWRSRDLWLVAGVSLGLLVFFYSGGLLDSSALHGVWKTYTHWVQTGTGGETGHEKEWSYWLQLIGRYEWPAAAGFLAAFTLVKTGTNRLLRYLAIASAGTLVAYSIIAYKTPWCLIVLIWPFFFFFGYGVIRLATILDRSVVNTSAGILCLLSLTACLQLNFRNYTDESEPYVYVQTLPDINKLMRPLGALTALDPTNYHLKGWIIMPDHHPMVWMLGDYTRVELRDTLQLPDEPDAAFLLIDDTIAEELEGRMKETYFRETVLIRGNAEETSVLYLNEKTFGALFPTRTPEFIPGRSPTLKLLDLHALPLDSLEESKSEEPITEQP